MARRGVQVVDLPPGGLASALTDGDIEAGPTPVPDWFQLEDRFHPVAGFCVSASHRAGSSLLYSQKPIEELDGAAIGAAGEDAASVQLLRVLLALKYGLTPGEIVTPKDSPDALLLTGNNALRRRRGVRGFSHRYDLGAEWNQWTELPFVFSRWIARNDLDPKDLALLQDTLYVGLEDGVDGLYHLSEPRDDLLMLAKDIMAHIQGIRYFVGVSEQKSIDLFRGYLAQLDPAG
jgi:chorismate dehydratase